MTGGREYQQIRYEVADHVATLTLHRPEKLNVYSVQMMEEMIDAFDRADRDDEVRAIVVTGEGKAFCAGADLEMGAKVFDAAGTPGSPIRADGSIDYAADSARDFGGRLTLRIFASLKPVIGAINGAAVGIGATMLLPMDIRIASETARFGFVFTRRGILPEGASAWFLPRIAGIAQALEWCLSGRLFTAEEALSGRLVSRVVAPDKLLATAHELAVEIAANAAPVSVAVTRQLLWRGLGMAHPMEAHSIDSRGVLARGRSRDAIEGVSAFLEKRLPAFPDRVSADMPDFFPWWVEPSYE